MTQQNNNNPVFTTTTVLSDGNGSFTLCPELLTEQEAIRYLRLDIDGPAKPENTLRYYRGKKKLRATRIGKKLLYSRKTLNEFIEKMTG